MTLYIVHWEYDSNLSWKDRGARIEAATDDEARTKIRAMAAELKRVVGYIHIGNTPGNIAAGEGQVWVCGACGKRSRDKYGFQKIDHGWDESCMLNACLCIDNPALLSSGRPDWKAVTPQPGELILEP